MPIKSKNAVKGLSNSDEDIPSKFMSDLEEIKQAESRKEFQSLLSEIIWRVPEFNSDELAYLSNLIKSPPKFPGQVRKLL